VVDGGRALSSKYGLREPGAGSSDRTCMRAQEPGGNWMKSNGLWNLPNGDTLLVPPALPPRDSFLLSQQSTSRSRVTSNPGPHVFHG